MMCLQNLTIQFALDSLTPMAAGRRTTSNPIQGYLFPPLIFFQATGKSNTETDEGHHGLRPLGALHHDVEIFGEAEQP